MNNTEKVNDSEAGDETDSAYGENYENVCLKPITFEVTVANN